jgi:uncharacterized protein
VEKGWRGLPYHPISEHYKRVHGEKVYKLPVTVVDNCPNRMGLKGMKTCSFCDVWGSAARSESGEMTLKDQIEKYQIQLTKEYNSKKFMVYFQAYTNSFTKVSQLRENFDLALSYPFVVGFVLGTRPDCLSPAVLEMWQEYNQKSYVAIELGVQSFFEDDLEFMRRGHTAEDSLKAIKKISSSTSVDLGIHLIFGNPNETDERLIETARRCNDLPITNVKLHNLHVLKNTALAEWHSEGKFTPIDRNEYARRVLLFLEHLHPRIALHRLAAFASRWDELIAPAWTADKMGTHQALIDYIRAHKSYQGKELIFSTAEELFLQEKMRHQSLSI